VAMAVAALSLVVLGLAPGVVASLVAFAVWGLAFGAVPPLLQTRLLQSAPARQRDAASALYTTAFNVGIGGGALVGAVLFERIGVQGLPLLYAAVLAVVAVVLVGAATRRVGQPRSTVAVETGPVRPSAA
jgi:DHA1 family inner membrane transport protein